MDKQFDILRFHQQICYEKQLFLKKNQDSLSTIVLGSSHGHYGLDPTRINNTCNLCTPSQDLKYSFLLYRKAVLGCKNLRYVILFYSFFSPGHEVEKSPSESVVGVAINEQFDLGLRFDNDRLLLLSNKAKDFKPNFLSPTEFEAPFPPKHIESIPCSYGANNRANDHLRLNIKLDALPYLYQIFGLASLLNHKVFIVLPPYRSDYAKFMLTGGGDRYRGLDIAIQKVDSYFWPVVLDFFSNQNFHENDFLDFDHLDPLGDGPRKLSEMVKNNMSIFGDKI